MSGVFGLFAVFCSSKKTGNFLAGYTWDRFLEVRLMGQKVNEYVALLDIIKYSSTVIVPSGVRVPIPP